MKRIAIVVVALVVVVLAGLALFARSVLTGDAVRAAVASQVSRALGQPVTIGSLGVSIYPRVTMDLGEVAIGDAGQVHLTSMHLGTGLRALLSRRIEGAAVRIDGARLTLPLPAFAVSSGETSEPSSEDASAPVEIVSIDEIVLRNVEVVSGGRTVQGDIELVPQGQGVQVRRIALAADDARVELTGELTSLAPLNGRLEASAEMLDLDRLLAFLSDFAGASGSAAEASPAAGGPATGIDGQLTLAMRAARVTTGGLALSDLEATALLLPQGVTFDPITFGIFGGRYQGRMEVALGDTPTFAWRATVSGIDTAALMAFAGSPNTITGTLGGRVELDGTGLEMEQALRTARGSARVDITNGTIAGLSLVRAVVTASSGRGGVLTSASTALTSRGESGGSEAFSRLGATLAIAGGRLTTKDVAMTSPDVDLDAAGSMTIASMQTAFSGRVRLSETLSKEAGTDLYRYTQQNGRVTLPVEVSGPIEALNVRVDIADAATRAIKNRAADEAKKVIERNIPSGLRGLLKKKGGG